MQRVKSVSNSFAGRCAMAAGTFMAAGGVVEIVHSQANAGSHVVGVAGHLVLGFFLVSLILLSPALIALSRHARSSVATKAGLAAATGTVVLGLTCITSLVNGQDYSFFNVVAPLTNAAWLFGSVVIAFALKRSGRVATPIAVGLPLLWIAAIPLATHGFGLLAAAYLIPTGYRLATDTLERSPQTEVVFQTAS